MVKVQDVTVDTGEVDAALDDIKQKTDITVRSVISNIRRAWDTAVIFTYLAGEVIGQSYELMAQALFVGAETLSALASAEAITVVLGVKAVISFGLAVALYAKGLAIRFQGEQASRDFDRVIMLLNLWRMYTIGFMMMFIGMNMLWQMKRFT